jgi:hypothetical protein
MLASREPLDSSGYRGFEEGCAEKQVVRGDGRERRSGNPETIVLMRPMQIMDWTVPMRAVIFKLK